MLIIGLSAALLGLPAAGLANGAGAQAPTRLSQDLDALLASPSLVGANAGLVVKDAATGATLYDHHGSDLLVPASNLKLFTSAAAMNVLGPDYTFSTTVEQDGAQYGSTLAGNLYLKGNGDPTMVDGSGLSRQNYVSADQISALLLGAQQQPWFSTWYDSLPVAGVSDRMIGGSLRTRMVGTPAANNLRAKTGSMKGSSALSGYVTAANGEKLVFSMVENNFLPSSMSSFENAVGVRLAEYDGATDVSHAAQIKVNAPAVASTDPKAGLECTWIRSC
jgi:D-alanyl-D-alanine carboxypeptidase